MNVLRRTWRSIRHATKPLRHRVGSLRSQGRIQHTVPILPEDRAYKRRRWHVLVDLIHEHCHDRALTVAEIGIDQGFTSSYLIKYCPQIERISALLKQSVKKAEDAHVRLAIENHIDFTADEILEILHRVDSEFLGPCLPRGSSGNLTP